MAFGSVVCQLNKSPFGASGSPLYRSAGQERVAQHCSSWQGQWRRALHRSHLLPELCPWLLLLTMKTREKNWGEKVFLLGNIWRKESLREREMRVNHGCVSEFNHQVCFNVAPWGTVFNRHFTVRTPVATWHKIWTVPYLIVEACKKWIKISVLFYCLLGLRNAVHKNNDPGCGRSARWGWFLPHHLNPAQEPSGQVDVAAGISRHQYMWVEQLENTCSVRSRIHCLVIQALCHDMLFLGMAGHYWLNKSFLWSWQMSSSVPNSGSIGREKDLE